MYIVYHGWIDGEPVAEFKTVKKAVKYIESQEYPEEYCFEKKTHRNNVLRGMETGKMCICEYCYNELRGRGERVKIVNRYAYDIREERRCDLCEEVDDLMEVETR